MLDENGYPTEDTLEKIRRWPEQWDTTEPRDLIEYLYENWHWEEYFVLEETESVLDLELHTGGWSGNEDIIKALQETIFWFFYWQKSTRGGHYYFSVPIE